MSTVRTKRAKTFLETDYWLAWDEPLSNRGVGIGSSEQEAIDSLNREPPTDVLGKPEP